MKIIELSFFNEANCICTPKVGNTILSCHFLQVAILKLKFFFPHSDKKIGKCCIWHKNYILS